MIEAIIDANAVLRFLSNDVPLQAKKMEKRFAQVEEGKLSLKIIPVTVAEVVYHLEHWYTFSRGNIAKTLTQFFHQTNMEIDGEDLVLESLKVYSDSKIDFVDLLLWARAKEEGVKVLSFDKHFDKLSPKLRLDP